MLIITGDDDRNVMFGQSIDLKNKLDALGVYNKSLVFPDEVHGFLRYASRLRAYLRTVDFFDRLWRRTEPMAGDFTLWEWFFGLEGLGGFRLV